VLINVLLETTIKIVQSKNVQLAHTHVTPVQMLRHVPSVKKAQDTSLKENVTLLAQMVITKMMPL
jgi:hypothetical protein